MELPHWVKRAKVLDQAGLERIEAAVRRAELKTSGEIVPILVRRSMVNALGPYMLALIFLLAALVLKHFYFLWSLEEGHVLIWSILFLLAAGAGFQLGRLPFFQQRLLPKPEQLRQADQRALLEFYGANLKATKGGTGILLFVSWQEHRAIVLADEGIAQHCQNDFFREVVQDLVTGAKRKDIASGFEAAINRCGDLLAQHFPRYANDVNELRDHLIIRDH